MIKLAGLTACVSHPSADHGFVGLNWTSITGTQPLQDHVFR